MTLLRHTTHAALATTLLFAGVAPATTAHALDEKYENAVQAALHGPELKEVSLFGHEFNIKQASIVDQGGTLKISGQISHCLTGRPDDQVFYSYTIKGEEDTLDITKLINEGIAIEQGGAFAPIWWAGEFIEDMISEIFDLGPENEGYLPYGDILSNVDEIAEQGAANWEEAASIMIAMITLRAWEEQAPQNPYLNSASLMPGSEGYTIFARTLADKYWAAEGGGGTVVNANRDAPTAFAKLRMIDLDGGKFMPGDVVRIAAPNGQYLRAAGCGGSTVTTTGSQWTACGQFTVERVSSSGFLTAPTSIKPNETVAFRTNDGHYLSAVGMDGRLNAEPTVAHSWEHFKLSFTPKNDAPPENIEVNRTIGMRP